LTLLIFFYEVIIREYNKIVINQKLLELINRMNREERLT